ncbi:LamG-like jellyroll fold domain-containing protein [Microcystis aeruginosa 1339]|uniref:LamG-like jellyroll fold domain-containing protein n=2 Tax=Microcystis TaxID=1125 RepID=UPI0031344F53
MAKFFFINSGMELFTAKLLNPTIWIKANAPNTLNLSGSNVTGVKNIANDLSFSATGAITVNTTELGGKSVLSINNTSSNQFLSALFNYGGNALTLVSLHRNLSDSSLSRIRFGRLWSLASSTEQDFNNTSGILLGYGINGTNGVYMYRNNAIAGQTSPLINNQWASVIATRNGSQTRIILNGGTPVNGNTSTASFNINRIRIGNDMTASDSGMNGFIAENLLWTRELSSSEINLLTGYLHWDWGMQSLLPSNHPYRNRPPYVGDV